MAVPLSASAKNYICPKCNSQIGERCKSPSGRICEYPHKQRFDKLSAAEIKSSEIDSFPDILKIFKNG